jgi:hypothetical protein
MNTFKVIPEGSGWCVVIHHPHDEDDFVVVDRSKMERDAHMICDALNGLFEAHVNKEKNDTILALQKELDKTKKELDHLKVRMRWDELDGPSDIVRRVFK